MERTRSRRRRAAQAVLVGLAALICDAAIAAPARARPAIHVDITSFAHCDDLFSGVRVAIATGELLFRYRGDFPQPPPLDIVIRAQSEAELARFDEALSFGSTELRDGRAFVVLNPRALRGPRALNDAELHSLLGHELRHAYQFARGPFRENSPELWRREVDAFEWELAHRDPGVRPWYRADTENQLRLYRALLESP